MSAELRDTYYKTLMNDKIYEIKDADKIINKMTSEVPTDDIKKIRCADCKKEIKEGDSLFDHIRNECPGCLHWEFPVKKGGRRKTRKKRGGTNHCSICLKDEEIEDDDDHIRLSCGHIFCRNCIADWLDNNDTCPNCRGVVNEDDLDRIYDSDNEVIVCYNIANCQRSYDGSTQDALEVGWYGGEDDQWYCPDCRGDWTCRYCNQVITPQEQERGEFSHVPNDTGGTDLYCEACAGENAYLSDLEDGSGGGKRRKKNTRKKQFLYNPNDPSKSFDVYIDKNPNDTIPIKYTTIKDVEDTIKKLERLYKTKKYPHKRIWQVGMIMKVRLEAMNKYKKTRYKKAKKVFQRFQLANKYFKFLGERTKKKTFLERKKMTFNYKMPRRKTRKKQKGGYRMKETIIKFEKGPFPKKYTAFVKNKQTKKVRKIHFGDRRYQQYKDRTPLKLYKKNNHNTRKRMQNYFNRHSGTKKRGKAIKKEKNKSKGLYNAKILSHIYLW